MKNIFKSIIYISLFISCFFLHSYCRFDKNVEELTNNNSLQVPFRDSLNLKLEVKNGYLIGIYKNITNRETLLTRFTGDAMENFGLLITKSPFSRVLELSDFSFSPHFLHKNKFEAKVYEYHAEPVRPHHAVPLFYLKVSDIDKLEWNNSDTQSKFDWIQSNKMEKGTYKIEFYSSRLSNYSNPVFIDVP
jgi:hypothetical protein